MFQREKVAFNAGDYNHYSAPAIHHYFILLTYGALPAAYFIIITKKVDNTRKILKTVMSL